MKLKIITVYSEIHEFITDPDLLSLIPSDTFKYTRLRSGLDVLIIEVSANLKT